MYDESDVEMVQDHGDMLARCCLEHPEEEWYEGIVKKVLGLWAREGPYPGETENERFAIFLTDKGKFAILEDCEDYTGHGCQCDSGLAIFETMEMFLRLGLTEEDANHIGAPWVEQRKEAVAEYD